jgi:(hydroxyamino)benzene mutase
MSRNERYLCVAGLGLFLLGLLQVFFIPLFERVDAARAAHATALGSGTFLIAVGLLWPKLEFPTGRSEIWTTALAASLHAIAIGLTLGSAATAGSDTAYRLVSWLSLALNAGGAVVLVVALVAILLACRSARPESADAE